MCNHIFAFDLFMRTRNSRSDCRLLPVMTANSALFRLPFLSRHSDSLLSLSSSPMLRSLLVSRFRPSTRQISSIVLRTAALSIRFSPSSFPAVQFRPFASKKKSSAKSAAAAADASLALQREAQSHFDEALQAEFSGRLADAEAAALQSLALRRRAFNESDNHDHVIESLTVLGHIYLAAQQADTAVPYMERAVVAALVVHGEQNADNQIPSLTALALALQLCASPDLPRAEELLTRASGITDRRFAKHGDKLPDHPQRARRLSEMAVLRRSQGRHDEALSLFRQSLDMRRRCYGDDAEYFAGIARDHTMFGDQQAAGDIPHPDLCQSYGHIGMHLFAHAQQLANQVDPAAAARAAQAKQDKTDADDDSSPLGEAVTALYRAVHLQHVHARVHQLRPNFAVHEALAAALTRMGRVGAATRAMHAASELCRTRYGADHPALALAWLNEAQILQLCALHADFESARVSNMRDENSATPNHTELSGSECTDRALSLLMSAFEVAGAQFGLSHAVTVKCAAELVDVLLSRRGYQQAAALIDEICDIHRSMVADQSDQSASDSLNGDIKLSRLGSLSLNSNSPFSSVYPSFSRQPLEVHLAALHRARGQIAQSVRDGGDLQSNSASVPWEPRARAEFSRALELLQQVSPTASAAAGNERAGRGSVAMMCKHVQSLLDRVPQ